MAAIGEFVKMTPLNSAVFILLLCLITRTSAQGSDQVLRYNILEENEPQKVLGNVAVDAGLDTKYGVDALQKMQFAFLPQSSPHKDLFIIEDSGVLIADKQVDRDEICPNMVTCAINLAVSVQPGEYFTIIEVEVTVEDSNDNTPTFPESSISRSILEASMPGTSISIPAAEDNDSPPYMIKQYDLVSGLDAFDLRVDTSPDGTQDLNLVLKTQVDREKVEFYQAEVVAYDGGVPRRTGTLTVNIQVTDINDNKPVFDNSTYEVFLNENVEEFTTVFQVHAVDPDAGQNGEVLYGFTAKTQQQHGDVFQIDENTGKITIISGLNYETDQTYNLGVTAKDKNPDSSPVTARVIIHVQDVNDHAPSITVNNAGANGHVKISEHAKLGDFVAHITVVDKDGGNNGEFNCTISGQQFSLQQMENYKTEFKIITASTFDRELQASYNIAFMCQDKGIPAQASTKHIIVDITDENDHAPMFTKPIYDAYINENNFEGASIIQVNATDLDAGDNAAIEYRLNPNMKDLFAIGPQSGNVTAKVRLDYEQVQSIEIGVIALDHGNPPKSSSATVLLKVNDLDDEPPKFLEDKYKFTVPEQVTSGFLVGKVSAEDPDTIPNSDFVYTLDPRSNVDHAFAIEPKNGTLFTARMLDREARQEYHLRVRAISAGSSSLTGTADIFITVQDKNDNPPTIDFPNPYNNTVYITHDIPRDHILAQVLSHDDDYGENAEMRYEIISGNEDGLFSIHELLGFITTTAEVRASTDRLYGLVVMVRDQGDPVRTSEAMLNIVVNKTGSFPRSDSALMPGPNLTIVITIAIVSGLLAVVLLVAIVVIWRAQRKRDAAKKKYNYMPRIVDQQIYMSRSNSVVGNNKSEETTAVGYIPTREPTLQEGEKAPSGHYNSSYEKGTEMIEKDYPNKEKMPETPDSVFVSNPELGPGGLYKPTIPGPWNMDPDHHRILYQSDHLVQKPWGLPSASLQEAPQAGGGDKDSDSQCSADLSNATDSGHGSNDGGSDGHHDFHPSSPTWHQDNRDGSQASSPWPTPSKPRPPARVSSINSSGLPPGVHRTPSSSTQHSDNSVSMAPDGRRHQNKHPLPPRSHKTRHNVSRTGSREEHRQAPREDHVYYNGALPAGPTRSQGVWNLSDNGGGGGAGRKKKYASHV